MTKNAEILSDDFLSEIGEGKSPLHIYASDLDYYRPKIEQLKRMWRELPESIKQDKDLYKSLHSKKNGQFQGAISELISAWFLNNYFSSMIKDLKVGTFTPDFYCEKDQYKLLFETFSLSRDHAEIIDDQNMKLLREEIKCVNSNKGIYLIGGIHPNTNGTFEGIGGALQKYLDEVELDDSDHELVFNGAKISFSIFDKGPGLPVMCGRTRGVSSDDPNEQRLLESILKKRGKYFFPHVEICVVDSTIRLSETSLITTLIGHQQLLIDRNDKNNVQTRYSNTGFWGIENPNIDKNLHVQAFIIIWQNHLESNEFQLKVCIAENHHLSTAPKLTELFKDIPDILSGNYDGKRAVFKP